MPMANYRNACTFSENVQYHAITTTMMRIAICGNANRFFLFKINNQSDVPTFNAHFSVVYFLILPFPFASILFIAIYNDTLQLHSLNSITFFSYQAVIEQM